MLKLVYDLRVGFEDCYLTIKNQEWDISGDHETFIENPDDEMVPWISIISEKDFYNKYYNNIGELLKDLEDDGTLEILYEDSVLTISKLYFSHMLGGSPIKHIVPVWLPSNWRLVYEPTSQAAYDYANAISAAEVMSTLKLSKQQLYYYVKTEQIRKVFNPKNTTQFKYDRKDVQVLQKKLEKKYAKYR